MARYTLDEFLQTTAQTDKGQGLFELETPRLLELNLGGPGLPTDAWIKMGSMVGYTGQVKFTREGILQQGMGNLLKKAVSGEGARLTKAEGVGRVYLADNAKKVTILQLQGEAIFVNGNDVLAFDASIRNEIRMMKKISGLIAGGLFNVRLQGQGLLAITSHYDPVTLRVAPGLPVYTDPNATVAWSGDLEPSLKTDVSFKTFLGRGSGDSIQMRFDGDGFVVIQPMEEVYFQAGG
ncbi:AIM24 family protein [Botrimarina sp.]|uniref:AIM24 family protein n=1 Tax=Botrimarina sp. TaxID=2795802 RepID=UPI0032EF3750